jgi:hypothetical protein
LNKTISGILKRLRPRFQRMSPQPSHFLGLLPEELRQVERLTQQPGWRAYHKALEHLFHLEAEGYFHGLPHDEYLKKSGLLAGFRRAASLPDELGAALTRMERAADDRAKHDHHSHQSRLSKLVNTPFWRGDRAARMAGADDGSPGVGPG